MARKFYEIGFTPSVLAEQVRRGSRQHYDREMTPNVTITDRESDFIAALDGFYIATVNRDGWPYMQFRGGPPGFVRHAGNNILRFPDFRGNQQFLSVGNSVDDPRCSLFFMDYPAQRRLKILGMLRFEDATDTPELRAEWDLVEYRAKIERVATVEVVAYDWNCAQHIPRRLTVAEFVREEAGG